MFEGMDEKKPMKKRNFNYPAETKGSRAAAGNRAKMNGISQEEAEKLYELAQELMHGGHTKPKVGSRQ